MAKRKPLSYWEMRRALEMYEELIPIEIAADDLRRIYLKASKEMEREARKLLKTFQINNGLTEKEAKELLSRVMDPADIQQVLLELKKDPARADLVAQIEGQAYGARISRLQKAQADAEQVVEKIYERSGPIFEDALTGIAKQTNADEVFGLHQRVGAAFRYNPVSDERIQQIIQQPWSGENYSKILWGNTQELAQRVKEEMVKGVLTGKSNERMRQDIQDAFSAKASDARRLIRTEAAYVSGQIRLETYKQLGIKEYVYTAILDSRASKICRDLDGKHVKVAEARVGDPLHPYPPMHPYCRSTTIAVLPKELMDGMMRSAVDPETGELMEVPMDMTYKEWEKLYGPDKKKGGAR